MGRRQRLAADIAAKKKDDAAVGSADNGAGFDLEELLQSIDGSMKDLSSKMDEVKSGLKDHDDHLSRHDKELEGVKADVKNIRDSLALAQGVTPWGQPVPQGRHDSAQAPQGQAAPTQGATPWGQPVDPSWTAPQGQQTPAQGQAAPIQGRAITIATSSPLELNFERDGSFLLKGQGPCKMNVG